MPRIWLVYFVDGAMESGGVKGYFVRSLEFCSGLQTVLGKQKQKEENKEKYIIKNRLVVTYETKALVH